MSRLRVLMYHKVAENSKDFLTVTTVQLMEQLQWLKARYTIISLRDLTDAIGSGKTLPDNAMLITFDDGYENNFTLAYPIFKNLGIPFTIFLVADFIGKKVNYDGIMQSFLSIGQLQSMQDIVQYGHHGFNHRNLMNIPRDKWHGEIEMGVSTLEKLGLTIEKAWAYTYGVFPKKNNEQLSNLRNIFNTNGILCAFRIGNRINKFPIKEPFSIQRIDIRGNESFLKFKLKVLFGKLF